MKPLFIAIIFLHWFLSTVYIAAGSNCMCNNNDLISEIYFVPGTNTPLTEGCLTDDTELQMLHDMAGSRYISLQSLQNLTSML